MPGRARDLVVLDRDGVINRDSDAYIKGPEEWISYPSSIEAIARLVADGMEVVVATNQSGVGRGLLDYATLEAIHAKMRREVEAAGGRIAAIYVCPHRPDEGCACRKPAPGLLREIEADRGASLVGVPMIGDKRTDLLAALAVGARPILVRSGQGQGVSLTGGLEHCEVFADLAAAADALVAERRAARA